MVNPEDKLISIAGLHDRHLEVLHLVARHLNSKEIARTLGISPDTVDQRLKRIKALTGVSGRSEAARLYAEAVAIGLVAPPTLYGSPVYQAPDLASALPAAEGRASPIREDGVGEGHVLDTMLHEARAKYSAATIEWSEARGPFDGLLAGGRPNDLPLHLRLLAIVSLACGFVLIVAALVAIAEGLTRLV